MKNNEIKFISTNQKNVTQEIADVLNRLLSECKTLTALAELLKVSNISSLYRVATGESYLPNRLRVPLVICARHKLTVKQLHEMLENPVQPKSVFSYVHECVNRDFFKYRTSIHEKCGISRSHFDTLNALFNEVGSLQAMCCYGLESAVLSQLAQGHINMPPKYELALETIANGGKKYSKTDIYNMVLTGVPPMRYRRAALKANSSMRLIQLVTGEYRLIEPKADLPPCARHITRFKDRPVYMEGKLHPRCYEVPLIKDADYNKRRAS